MAISEKKKENFWNVTKPVSPRPDRTRSGLFSGWVFFLGLSFLSFIGASLIAANKSPNKKSAQDRAWSVVRESLTSNDSAIREQAVQSLEYVDDPQAVKALLSSLDDESEYVQIWAARALIRKGNTAGRDTLLKILMPQEQPPKDASGPLAALVKMRALARGRLRGEAAKVLGLFKDPLLIPELRELKRDNDGRVRDGASVALALMGDQTEAVVFASALNDKDKGVRLAALEALEAMRDPRYVTPVENLLSDPEPEIRALAVKTLGGLKNPATADAIAPMLTDENGVVRETAAWALGEVQAASKMANLKASLSDPNAYVKVAAASSLGRLGDSSGLPVLEAALNSNDTDARAKAALALGTIEDKNTYALAAKTLEDGNIRVRLGAAFSVLKY